MPNSIFNVNDNSPDCSIFAPQDGYGAETVLSFVRSTLRVNNNLTQPRLNSSGETQLSFATLGSYLMSLQPMRGGYVRLIQGTLTQINFVGFLEGNPDIIESDRCSVSGKRLEVVNVLHYGTESTEIELKYLAR